MKYIKFSLILIIIVLLFTVNINAESNICSTYEKDTINYAKELSNIVYPFVSDQNYADNEIIPTTEIDKIIDETDEILNFHYKNINAFREKYDDCELNNQVKTLYDSLIVLYKNVCQKLDRGIKIEEVAKDEFKPMVGYCKIKNDLSYEITDKVTADIEKFVNDYKSESSNLEFSTKNIKINKKSTLESIEESTYENFGWIINKLPFDNKKNNFYLFVLIVFLAIYYILFKRK